MPSASASVRSQSQDKTSQESTQKSVSEDRIEKRRAKIAAEDVERLERLQSQDKAKTNQFLVELANRHFANAVINKDKKIVKVEYLKSEIEDVIVLARESLKLQKTLLEVDPPVTIVGDIHGQFKDLLAIFCTIGIPPNNRYLFLGDYVDRGPQNMECIVLLFVYKVLYPNQIFLLRGNHEVERHNKEYAFREECRKKLGKDGGEKIWKYFQTAFDYLPVCGLVGEKILCMHGGLSPELNNLDQIRCVDRPLPNPSLGLVNDLLWADPEVEIRGWQPSPRNTSWIFGDDVVRRTCRYLKLDLIVRAHQVCRDGYRFFANRRLLTIFSAPMYCSNTKNSAACLKVAEDMVCSFVFFIPLARKAAPVKAK